MENKIKKTMQKIGILAIGSIIVAGISTSCLLGIRSYSREKDYTHNLIETFKKVSDTNQDGVLENQELAKALRGMGYQGTIEGSKIYILTEDLKSDISVPEMDTFSGSHRVYLPKSKLEEFVGVERK